jgi:hypothetical protein
MRTRKILLEIICLLFFALFLYTAVSKAIDIERFKWALGKSPLFKNFKAWMPYPVIGIELIVAVLLLWPKARLTALYASMGLMGLFTAYVIFVLQFSRVSHHLPCSCGGVISQMNWSQHLFFNILFLGLSWLGIVFYDRQHIHQKYLLQ